MEYEGAIYRGSGHFRQGRFGAKVVEAVAAEYGVGAEMMPERQRGTWLRPVAAKMLCRYGGLTQRAAAGMLRMTTGSAVSAQIRRLAAEQSQNRQLRRQLDRIERVLTAPSTAN